MVDPAIVAATWGDDILRRSFYATPGISSSAKVIHHTHTVVVLGSSPIHEELHEPLASIDDKVTLITQGLAAERQRVYAVHIESDTRLSRAVARIGIIENIETRA